MWGGGGVRACAVCVCLCLCGGVCVCVFVAVSVCACRRVLPGSLILTKVHKWCRLHVPDIQLLLDLPRTLIQVNLTVCQAN